MDKYKIHVFNPYNNMDKKKKKMLLKKVVETIAYIAKCTFNKTNSYFLENIVYIRKIII